MHNIRTFMHALSLQAFHISKIHAPECIPSSSANRQLGIFSQASRNLPSDPTMINNEKP